MSAGIHAPDAVARSDSARGRPRLGRADVVRLAAHLAAWTPFAYALVRALRGGWLPVSDSAVIALRSWDVLSVHTPLIGQATRLAHGAFDLGPLEYWLLTLPVHLLPAQGVLWGGAAWCMVAGSVAIEAAWAAGRQPGAVLASGLILGTVALTPGIAMVPVWNPWFGMMFFIAALAAGWAVLSGYQKWFPALVITGSVAAQAHLMYAIAVAGLLLVAFIMVAADSRRSGKYRWLIIGIIAGLVAWTAPLIQQFTARTGNLTQLIDTVGTRGPAQTGFGFGLKALSAAVQSPACWWNPATAALTLNTIVHRAAWAGAAQLGITVLALILAIFVLRSRRAAALTALSLLTAAAALKTYSGIPASNLQSSATDLSYLMVPVFLMGMLTWLVVGYVLVLAIWQVTRGMRGRTTAAPWGPRIAGLAAVALLAALTAGAAAGIGGASPGQSAARNAIRVAAAKIEREIPPQRLAITVSASSPAVQHQATIGLLYALRTAGYAPESGNWVYQLDPAYRYDGGPVPHATVLVPAGGPVIVKKLTSSPKH